MQTELDTRSSATRLGPSPERPTSLLLIELRLNERFPDVCRQRIRSCVDEAAAATAGARVQQFLPILIERRAADALRVPEPAPPRSSA
jgi:hypothetical protein